MSPAVKAIKTNKEMNASIILGAISNNKPITIRTYYLTKASQDSLKNIISLILEKYGKSDSMDTCYNSVRGLVVNATRANIKRILFKKMKLDITNPREYQLGMSKIEKQLVESSFYKFKEDLMKSDLTVKTTFTFNREMFTITVKNNFVLYPHEFQLTPKNESEKSPYLSINHKSPTNLAKDGKNDPKIVSLNQYKMDQQIFSQVSNVETNETILKLDIVLKDKNTFNTEVFSQKIDALYENYKAQFGEALDETIEETSEKNYLTVSKNLSKTLGNGLRGKGEFLNLLSRIQNLDSQLFREQQMLLANYGENVFSTIQDNLTKVRVESNEIIGQIQKISKETIEINQKQLEEFVFERNLELKKQTELEIQKQKDKLEEFNTHLDNRIENQSLIIKSQVDSYLDKAEKRGSHIIDSTKTEINKVKEEFKEEIQAEIHIAELLKHDLMLEIGMEKDVLEKTLKTIIDDVRKVEKFQANSESIEKIMRQSEDAISKMNYNIEVIKAKEENIDNFMNNINLLEAAIRNTEKEIKILDREKTEFLSEKGKVVQNIDSKLRQMEKFGEEMKQKLIEISGFEKKLNIISSSLADHVKKTKSVDEQLGKITKEVSVLESKRNDLNKFVSEVDQKVALINSKTADLKLMESKFNHIENIMTDLSARHKQIITMEVRLNDMKSNIEKLITKADDKISEINSALVLNPKTSKGRPRKVPPKLSGVVQEIKENVIALKKKRQSIPEIAQTLDLSEEMVSLILSMQ